MTKNSQTPDLTITPDHHDLLSALIGNKPGMKMLGMADQLEAETDKFTDPASISVLLCRARIHI
ncbi:hypothetical protein [Hyphomonas sp.]|uniref:hypothetical protein n=1 Tax=Hyphomonas sp. TaxID=87 RepID=UPI003567FBF7